MALSGFIKDYRKELQSDIWLMPPLYHRVWQWLKYQVNHEPNEIPMLDGTKFKIKKGQRLTSVRKIAQGIGWYEGMIWKEPNPKTVSNVLVWLEKNGMILIERGRGNRQYTLITLLNWDKHQCKSDGGNSKVTGNGEGKKQVADINKELKELIKNDKNKRLKEYTSNPLLLESLNDFVKMRKANKGTFTDKALTLLLGKLDKLAKTDQQKIDLLNESILNGWKGIFPIKQDNGPNKQNIKKDTLPSYISDQAEREKIKQQKNKLEQEKEETPEEEAKRALRIKELLFALGEGEDPHEQNRISQAHQNNEEKSKT